VACELLLWVVAPVRFHEWMLWIPDGHVKGRAAPGQLFHTADGYPVRINRLGFRGADPEWQPAPGSLRIAAFGGSSTFCYHASGEENTWPGRLELELEAALAVPVEVVNLGLPGYDTATSKVNYLFVGRALHPHVALLYHTWNDMKWFRRLEVAPQPFAGVAANKPLWQRVARATQLGRRLRNALMRMQLLRVENYYTTLEQAGATAHQRVAPDPLAWAEQNFRDFARFALADGVLPVLLSQATLVHPSNFDDRELRLLFHSDFVGMTAPIMHDTWTRMTALVRDVAASEGAVFVDGYAAVPHDTQHLADHVHLTERGASVLAQAVAAELLADPRFQQVVRRLQAGLPHPETGSGR
jgi:lysophospholipase L1-like esterase